MLGRGGRKEKQGFLTLIYCAKNLCLSNGRSKHGPMPLKSKRNVHATIP